MVTLVRKLCQSSEYKACIVGARIINPLQFKSQTECRERLSLHPPQYLLPHPPGFRKRMGLCISYTASYQVVLVLRYLRLKFNFVSSEELVYRYIQNDHVDIFESIITELNEWVIWKRKALKCLKKAASAAVAFHWASAAFCNCCFRLNCYFVFRHSRNQLV